MWPEPFTACFDACRKELFVEGVPNASRVEIAGPLRVSKQLLGSWCPAEEFFAQPGLEGVPISGYAPREVRSEECDHVDRLVPVARH